MGSCVMTCACSMLSRISEWRLSLDLMSKCACCDAPLSLCMLMREFNKYIKFIFRKN
ncbi:hypothetical protein BX661DRAFT_181324 [Kickxella alabastrina]|uniref:uncharacterized protein n=1 Tax=Kickxella alabastrina TaxID=61397 RepID=UPI00221E74A3|nr:uncharacterized protein BX661DRAFT_181324 [Kickxella alabastrina]KAI7829069.1 hypothetical protein BX661DRAFT_181324 [Kickxella alabastrina]